MVYTAVLNFSIAAIQFQSPNRSILLFIPNHCYMEVFDAATDSKAPCSSTRASRTGFEVKELVGH